jgi:Rrf2 family nitric oxide-sensitive transcriptional repressor
MRLTRFTDFGLRTLMLLASEPGRLFTTEIVADELRLSRNHLTKVVRGLRAAGFVTTLRGVGGGLRLALPPAEIRIGAVARRLEGGQPLVECFRSDGGACVLTPRCRLKGRLFAAREAFFRELDAMTLAECVLAPPPPPARSQPLAAPPDPR